jgi:hypothetical protein
MTYPRMALVIYTESYLPQNVVYTVNTAGTSLLNSLLDDHGKFLQVQNV